MDTRHREDVQGEAKVWESRMDPYVRVLVTGCGEVNVCDSARQRSKAYV